MLSPEGLRERRWGRFPALRKALEDKRIPDQHYGFTSVSDNMFDALQRLLETAVLAGEHQDDILAAARVVGPEQMFGDLQRLIQDLEAAAGSFRQQAERIRALIALL